jgi:hypothetical protein
LVPYTLKKQPSARRFLRQLVPVIFLLLCLNLMTLDDVLLSRDRLDPFRSYYDSGKPSQSECRHASGLVTSSFQFLLGLAAVFAEEGGDFAIGRI